jgi:hypothetical protein
MNDKQARASAKPFVEVSPQSSDVHWRIVALRLKSDDRFLHFNIEFDSLAQQRSTRHFFSI